MPPLAWRQVRPPACTVAEALARSVDLLARGECPALVVHSVRPAAITVGRAQLAEVDQAAAARCARYKVEPGRADGRHVNGLHLRPSAGDGRRGHPVHHERRSAGAGLAQQPFRQRQRIGHRLRVRSLHPPCRGRRRHCYER